MNDISHTPCLSCKIKANRHGDTVKHDLKIKAHDSLRLELRINHEPNAQKQKYIDADADSRSQQHGKDVIRPLHAGQTTLAEEMSAHDGQHRENPQKFKIAFSWHGYTL